MNKQFENLKINFFTLWILSKDRSIYVLEATEDDNPVDYIKEIYHKLIDIDSNVRYVYIDMSNFYGKYGEWVWECKFISDDNFKLKDVEYRSISNLELVAEQNKVLSKYIYMSQNV